MSLTKEAIEKLMNEAIKPSERIVPSEMGTFKVDNNGNVHQLFTKVEGLVEDPLYLHNLSSLVDCIKSDLERVDYKKYLHIESNTKVSLKGLIEDDGRREVLVVANARTPDFQFEKYYESESFLIALNSRFVNDIGRDSLIAFAGNVKEENARQTSDDGFSQKTSVKRGIASVQEELVPNPVKLAPFRTFAEIEQVPSEFIFRMASGPRFALFEADGGAWINDTIHLIEEYLVNALADEIEANKIVILS